MSDSKPVNAVERLAALEVVFAALAHAARRQILLTVHFRGSMSAGEIAARFAHAWPTTTRHLRVLEKAGLLQQERSGRNRVYSVNRQRLGLVRDWMNWFGDAPSDADPAVSSAGVPEERDSL